jgi:hypothetical protein
MSGHVASVPELIAAYLHTNYPAALESFLQAAKIPAPDAQNLPRPDLRTVVEDFVSRQLAERLGAVSLESEHDGKFSLDDLAKRELDQGVEMKEVVRTLEGVSAANLLSVDVVHVPSRSFDTATAS